jgi:formate dehydrogenase alpha subunit
MRLVLGQIIYHSGKLSTRDEGLMKIYDRPTLKISEADAASLELKNQDWVRVATATANLPLPQPAYRSLVAEETQQHVPSGVELAVEIMPSLPKGTVWFPEHFTDLKDLMRVTVDPMTHVPYFKSGIVSVKKVPLFDLTVVSSTSGASCCSIPSDERLLAGDALPEGHGAPAGDVLSVTGTEDKSE